MDLEGARWQLQTRPIPATETNAMSKKPSPNDQRSSVKNPTSSVYVTDRSNRQRLGHPNVPPAPTPTVQQPAPPKT